MTDTDTGNGPAGNGPAGDGSDPDDGGSSTGDDAGATPEASGDGGSDPDAAPSDGSDPSDTDDTDTDDDTDDDGGGINPYEAAYIAQYHVTDVSPPPPPTREAPFVARHAGISSTAAHAIDAVSHALALALAPPSIPPPILTNPVKAVLDMAIGDLPSAPPTALQPCQQTHWIEIVLVDQENQPAPGVAYKIVGPDGSLHTGSLDQNGFARVDGLPAGTCQVSFPDLEDAVWERQGSPGASGSSSAG
jgi:hypothetical protein